MENTFQIPARPWTDADVAFLTHNADLLPQEVRDELGLTPAIPDNNFQANFDAAQEIVAPVVETGEVDPVGVVPVVGEQATAEVVAPIEEEVVDVVIDATPVPETQPADVDNTATDNA